ncbi:CNH domain-containing protein [Mycena galericulata]|nr:CNH domain-containing protein [Mycena galericulata]
MPFPFTSTSSRGLAAHGSSHSGSKWNLLRHAVKTSSSEASSRPHGSSTPFPERITDQISTEIYELIMDSLSLDKSSLLACNLVCRSWAPRSRCLLLELMVCHPVPLVGHGGFGRIRCAAPYNQGYREEIIYGTTDGIYRGSRDGSRPRLLSIHDVSQIEILADVNLFLCIAGGVFMTLPLSALNAGTCRDSDIHRLSKHVVFFAVYRSTTPGESHRVCVLKTSALSGTIKAFDVVGNPQASTLVIARELYMPRETFSVRFLSRTRLAVALNQGFAVHGGFEMVDLTTATTQSLVDPDDPATDSLPTKVKPMSVFRVSDIFLLCFDKFGFYIDKRGKMIRNDLVMRWDSTPHSFALHGPYILAFFDTQVGVWNIETAEMVQKIKGPYYLLNSPDSGEKILALSLPSGEVTELIFRDG